MKKKEQKETITSLVNPEYNDYDLIEMPTHVVEIGTTSAGFYVIPAYLFLRQHMIYDEQDPSIHMVEFKIGEYVDFLEYDNLRSSKFKAALKSLGILINESIDFEKTDLMNGSYGTRNEETELLELPNSRKYKVRYVLRSVGQLIPSLKFRKEDSLLYSHGLVVNLCREWTLKNEKKCHHFPELIALFFYIQYKIMFEKTDYDKPEQFMEAPQYCMTYMSNISKDLNMNKDSCSKLIHVLTVDMRLFIHTRWKSYRRVIDDEVKIMHLPQLFICPDEHAILNYSYAIEHHNNTVANDDAKIPKTAKIKIQNLTSPLFMFTVQRWFAYGN